MNLSWVRLSCALLVAGVPGALRAAESLPIEREVAEIVKSEVPTVVHFWAPWCSNCYAEISRADGWAKFMAANPGIRFVFVTIWSGGQGDGRALLEKHGVTAQKNFTLLVHPNGERTDAERMRTFLGHEVNWVPGTWVFREGKIRYALNYGEVRFPILQQLIKDAAEKWE
jgi:thiol-disulfide isomerase/thioredoxin